MNKTTELTAIRDALLKCGVTGDSLFARIREDIERGLIREARARLNFVDELNATHRGTPAKPPAPEPDATYRCIGPGPRLEMFARPETPLREGYGPWGNEKASDVELSTSNTAPQTQLEDA